MSAQRHPISQRHIPLDLAGDRTRRDAPPPVIEVPRLVSETNPHGTRYVRALLRKVAEGAVQAELVAAYGERVANRPHSGGKKREPRGLCMWCGKQVSETSRYARACGDVHRTKAMQALAFGGAA